MAFYQKYYFNLLFCHIIIVSKISLEKNSDQKKEFHPIVPNLKYLSKAIELAVEIATFWRLLTSDCNLLRYSNVALLLIARVYVECSKILCSMYCLFHFLNIFLGGGKGNLLVNKWYTICQKLNRNSKYVESTIFFIKHLKFLCFEKP